MKKLLFLFFIPFILFSASKESFYIQRIDSHILIRDYSSALEEAKIAIKKNPKSNKLKIKHLECLALNNFDVEAVKHLNKLIKKNPDVIHNHNLLEEISWGIIIKGSNSSGFQTRLTASIGAYLTHDVRAVDILRQRVQDSNAIIRTVALQLASSYMDRPLKNEVIRLFDEEKLWLVKLEVIKAVGAMKIKEKQNDLKEIIASEQATFEEKEFATTSLVNIKDDIDLNEIKKLAFSPKAGLRKLAVTLAAYFNIKEAKEIVLKLAKDPIADVRIAALNAISLVYLNDIKMSKLKNIIMTSIDDPHPTVSITSSYIAALKGLDMGERKIKAWIFDQNLDNARFASSVLAHLTNKCNKLKKEILNKHDDRYVLVNLAIGLIAERKLLKKSSNIIFNFLKNEKEKLMFEERKNPLFKTLFPSHIRHVDQIPHYPEAVDQMTRLSLLSMLAIIEDPRASDAIKDFLQKKSWGITGFAAATLLKEGDAEALDIVRSALNDKDDVVRVQAALVLALLGKDGDVFSILEEAYKNADHDMKIQILEAIGHISSKKSISFLIDCLSEPYQNLRIVAASSLIRCING